jgi:NADH-quinone oxidoreductase subunit F
MSNFGKLVEKSKQEWEAFTSSGQPIVYLGTASCGIAAGAEAVKVSILTTLKKNGIPAHLMEVGCIGTCFQEPLMDISAFGNPRLSYGNVNADWAQKIILNYLQKKDPLKDRALGHFGQEPFDGLSRFFDLPIFRPQVRIVLKNCGFIDPENINHYLAHEGYQGLRKALGLSPDEVIEEVTRAGIRGRGGAGFPTGKKWRTCRDQAADIKYLIANADEGDPGAFMNRSLIESDPHALLEGMLIAGYAIGAAQGYVYIRAEYPLAIKRLKNAISQMKEVGLLGQKILGSEYSFEIKIKEGAGAFVCGEETALIQSIEGKRGMPRTRPPYPAVSGLHRKPTVINNVETLGTIPHIIRNGASWYHQFGVPGNHGTKTFSLVGKARRTGMIEVPLGIKLREIVFDIAGGSDKPFKAVQTGGPSGGCLSGDLLDTPVEYESLAAAGSIMGSGGLIVMDEGTCMVDVAKYFIGFCSVESCGKCAPCRLGTSQMLTVLQRICQGKGQESDIELLERIGNAVKATSLCGLGQTAPNPLLTTLRYFREEYVAHIREKRCPAGVCKDLIAYSILPDKCTGCLACISACPNHCITGEKKKPHVLDPTECVKCGACLEVCKYDAVVRR